MGWVGGQGMRPRSIFSSQRSSSGWREGCRRDWRAHCPAGREGGNSSERDRLAVFLGHKALLCFVNRAAGWEGGAGGRRRGPGTGGPAKRVPVLGRQDT